MRQLGFVILFFSIFLLISCKEGQSYNGYVDADLTYLSSDYSGRLKSLLVRRGQFVTKDQLLFTLERSLERIGASSTRFSRKNLYAQKKVLLDQIHYYQINYQRTLSMRRANAASQNDLDLAKEQLDVAKDQLEGVEFQIKESRMSTANWLWKINHKRNNATQNGIIFDTYFTQNEFVNAGQPVLSLITAQNIKIIFFIPEEKLSTFKLGQKIVASTNTVADLITGEVSYISHEAQYTPPIIYSREEREKLVFRVEARLLQPDLKTVHLGQPVTVKQII